MAADRRRDLYGVRPHGRVVCVRARSRAPRPAMRGQGARVGHADLRVHRARRRDGRVAAVARRGAAHADLPGSSARVRGRARVDRRARGREARRTLGRARRLGARETAREHGPARLGRRRARRAACC
jgi:hypothetical protein